MSEKLVRKWLLDDIADIDCNESWLSDLAGEGLVLDHLGARFAYFKRDTPRTMRYRFDVLSRMLTSDELGLYDSCGWHFVTLYNEVTFGADVIYYVFTTDENATVPELHTDPMEQAASLVHLHRQSTVNLVLMIALTAVVVGVQIYMTAFTSPSTRFNTLVYGGSNYIWTTFYAFYIWQGARRYLAVRRLRRRLSGGQTLDHHADYRKVHRNGKIANIAFWGIYGLLLLVLIGTIFLERGTQKPIPAELNFPAARLAELETDPALELSQRTVWNHQRYLTGAVVDDIFEEGYLGSKRVYLSTTCYRLPFAFEAPAVLEGMMDRYGTYFTENAHRADTEPFDEAWITDATDGRRECYLFARRGREVWCIYLESDTQGVENILPLLAEKLDG